MTNNSYLHGLSNGSPFSDLYKPPLDDELRAEDMTRPVVGDLLKPGMVVETSYGTGPYMIHRVTAHAYYEKYRAWSLVLIYQRDGRWPDKPTGNDFGYVNELVVSWENGEPRFRHLFLANDDEVRIIARHAVREDRNGQMSLL